MFFLVDNHQCVACEHWKGERYLTRNVWLISSPPDTMGICIGPNRLLCGKEVKGDSRIDGNLCFELWHCLKK